ncbi:hypothetical protein ALC60_03208 [Trachymyrmex zeteki]|uniref:Uncharacterized protein n=1 Tax=Mycetomoellerius zeteki TaxID=64791 RepID=A0A151XBV3_9HYME|nr:hypothetical protein ALC60_03208 [Trachymyrmex zeteki]
MDPRFQDDLNDVLLKRDHDSVDDFEHLGHDGSPDDRSEQQQQQQQQQHQHQPPPQPIDAPRVDDLLHIGDSFHPLDSVLSSALFDAEAKAMPATPPPSADFDKCAAMAQSSDPFQQPLDPVDPKLASMTFVETERVYHHQLHDDDDHDNDNEQEEIHLQPPLLSTSTATSTIQADSDLLLSSSMKAVDSKVQPIEEREDMLFTDYGKQYERDVTPLGSTDDFMQNIKSSMLPAPEKSPLIDFLGDDSELLRENKVKNITDDDSWNMMEKIDLKREQANIFEPPTKPLPPLPKEAQLLEKAHQDAYETSSDFLIAEATKPSPPLPQQTAESKQENIKRREISKPKETDHVSSHPISKKQEIEIAPKEIFRDMGLGECDRIFLLHFILGMNLPTQGR